MKRKLMYSCVILLFVGNLSTNSAIAQTESRIGTVMGNIPIGDQEVTVVFDPLTDCNKKSTLHERNLFLSNSDVEIIYDEVTQLYFLGQEHSNEVVYLGSECATESEDSGESSEDGGAESSSESIPFDYCAESFPTGGGDGYDNKIDPLLYSAELEPNYSNGTPKSHSALRNELQALISVATPGDIIFVHPQCSILVGSNNPIIIDRSITLVSDRGNFGSTGAVIYMYSASTGKAIEIKNLNFRINGVRISGFTFNGGGDGTVAIETYNNYNIEIDNNDICCWMDAIRLNEFYDYGSNSFINTLLDKSENAFLIHNNYIHHNHYKDDNGNCRGYGILLVDAYAKVYANIFELNRHDMAGAGFEKSGFEMYCNIFKEEKSGICGGQSNIDMHGANGNVETYAGCFMNIHHNLFTSVNSQANIFPVGKPKVICLVQNNIFETPSIYTGSGSAIDNRNSKTPPALNGLPEDCFGNVVAVNNVYNGEYKGWYVNENWDANAEHNMVRIPSSSDLLHSNLNESWPGANYSAQAATLDYWFGDFDADGQTDIFKADGNDWWVLPLNSGYTSSWIHIANSGYTIGVMDRIFKPHFVLNPELVFGNFNADNSTDVFRADGSAWKVSYSNTSTSWQTLATSTTTIPDLLFGRFTTTGRSDHITDMVFPRPSYNQWDISYDGFSWVLGANSNYNVNQMKTGDFDGDSHSDIFLTDGVQWYYSSNGISNWSSLTSSNYPAFSLFITDFNKDGVSDVIGPDNGWSISLSGNGGWTILTTSNFPLSNFGYGDLD